MQGPPCRGCSSLITLFPALSRGYTVVDLGSEHEGEACAHGDWLLEQARQQAKATSVRPLCLICGGETTVVVPDNAGRGGRNQVTYSPSFVASGFNSAEMSNPASFFPCAFLSVPAHGAACRTSTAARERSA
jgi:hypothetical protein